MKILNLDGQNLEMFLTCSPDDSNVNELLEHNLYGVCVKQLEDVKAEAKTFEERKFILKGKIEKLLGQIEELNAQHNKDYKKRDIKVQL